MLDWLKEPLLNSEGLNSTTIALRISISFIFGGVVAAIFRATRVSRQPDTNNIIPTLVLLTGLITMVTMAIGNSPARAFSLVGALSIVRFRTVVADTRDTAFVIFAVAVGMALGAGFLNVALIGLPLGGIAAWIVRPVTSDPEITTVCILTVKIELGVAHQEVLAPIFEKYCSKAVVQEVGTVSKGTAIELKYLVHMNDDRQLLDCVGEINTLHGVQGVELKVKQD